MAQQMCFDCLQRRIHSDFSGKLVFSYGLSDSAFPFGSSAVVQLCNSSGEAASAPQFLIKFLPSHPNDCLTKYVNEYVLDNAEGCSDNGIDGRIASVGVTWDEEEISSDVYSNEKPKSDSLMNEPKCLSNGGTEILLHSSTCKHSTRFSCSRVISALVPVSYVGNFSDSVFEELAVNSLTGSLEDHILNSLSLLIEGKASGRDSVNFLNLLGIPSFDENQFPGSLRHPNIAPVLMMVKASHYIDVALPKTPYTLENILHYSPEALKSDWHIRFLIYQLLSALAYIHGLGVAHGNICPSSVMLTESCWSWLSIFDKPGVGFSSSSRGKGCTSTLPEKVGCSEAGCPSQGLYADLKLSPSIDWHRDFNQWWRGEISNFEYLLILNRLAGRRWGDHTFHTVMPWVIDFSMKPDENSDAGWRDLKKSKWRLAKGDEQLDFTYSTSEFPHHVSDECLSELAVCSYKARRLPLSVLRMAVRSVYEPNEYPSTMQRLYQWTPDECIPEFYCNPQIFHSLHAGMTDLAVPSWADGPEEFIKLHRDALESERVSHELHHWIDITFGYKMSGEAAVSAKNVMLPSSEPMMPRPAGRRQLFTQPHPMRRGAVRKPCDSTNESTLHHELRSESSVLSETAYLQELEDASSFCEHAMHLSPLYGYHLDFVSDISPVQESSGENVNKSIPLSSDTKKNQLSRLHIDTSYLLEHIEVEDEGSRGYQELFLWREKSSCLKTFSEEIARDIFSVGCLLAELHLRKPLFDPSSLTMYLDSGVLPGLMHELPPHTKLLVEACIQKDCMRRPSAKCLLESPYFPTTVKASYLFLAPLQLLAKGGSCLQYAANFAKQGVLKAMGTFAAEMCAPYCLSFVVTPLSDTEAEWAYILLKEFIKSLTPKAVKTLVLPAIQKILQVAATTLMAVCERIGPDLTALHVLPQLKELFDELAFSPRKANASTSFGRRLKSSKPIIDGGGLIESRMDLARPSAKCLLESPYFPTTVKASYLFLAPLQLLAKGGSCLQYAANFAKQGVLKAMGTFAAEMCAPYCLSFVVTPLSDTEAEWAYILLKEFIKSLTPKAVKTLVLPAIQKILQTTVYSHLKVSILQDSFVREIWNRTGKQVYLETVHPLVILNLYTAAHNSSATAASVLLICSSEELGIPITIHQTILPLIQCFGKGLSSDGIDVLVRIGGLLGENFIVRQMLPLLKHVFHSCIGVSRMNKPEPVHSWSAFALIDCLTTIDGLVAFLPREVVAKELVEDKSCPQVLVLMETNFEHRVLQVAATTLMAVCERIGPDLTALHVLPQLKELFDELAFSPRKANASTSFGRRLKSSKPIIDGGGLIESRMDLALLLYPSFAYLLGIEKLRQCCTTWLLLEQYLLQYHNWKWEHTGELSRSGSDTILSKRSAFSNRSTPEYSPAKLLLNGVGWSIPQSQGTRGAKNMMPQKRFSEMHQSSAEMHPSNFKFEPWFWFPSPASSWDGPDFLARAGGVKDEHPWKIRASVIYSVRAHPGALRYLAVCPDECTVFTAGIGAGFKGTVQKWELARINCVSGYYGHEEVVNDICVLSSSGRVASCDGTIHVWSSRTGKLISVYSEPSVDSAHVASPPSSSSRANLDQVNMLSSNAQSSGILTGAFDGSLYTCMHQTELGEKLVVGTGNGSLRFIDVVRGQKLHLWRGDSMESGYPSLISSICSCGSDKMQPDGASSPSWIAAGLSSGHCRLFDARSGNVISSWKAHDGYVTKDGQQAVTCQKLYMADHGARNFSVLSSISILPFSRLFLVGTEDGYLRICC
ncbi:hypothetical protein C1H46_030897 [Malus baccata]|uniref:BEACH domain-containing protein n=1 Tax=Malus baccata TaxID=106549 RepID=A0A540LAJ2_MALBA|nr:hypothetical protein C1H46_030897 [Malus baccata]